MSWWNEGCGHEKSEVRRKATKATAERFVKQCLSCGHYVAVKGSTLTREQRRDAADFDQSLLDRAMEERRERFREVRAIENERREDESRKWWEWYERYLASDAWRDKRELVLRRAQNRCEGCRVAQATQVHHLTYVRVGQEMLFDLVAICRQCHDLVTRTDRAARRSA